MRNSNNVIFFIQPWTLSHNRKSFLLCEARKGLQMKSVLNVTVINLLLSVAQMRSGSYNVVMSIGTFLHLNLFFFFIHIHISIIHE